MEDGWSKCLTVTVSDGHSVWRLPFPRRLDVEHLEVGRNLAAACHVGIIIRVLEYYP